VSVEISVIIATRNRSDVLLRCLHTLAEQTVKPAELIIIDASDELPDHDRVLSLQQLLKAPLLWEKAIVHGAAAQRNQGMKKSNFPFVLFMDDDVYLQADVIKKLWDGMQRPGTGAVSSMITNQRYTAPGKLSRYMYRLMSGKRLDSYAGLVIGPAWNLLPEDRETLPEYVRCEWLNTTCTLYRKSLMPDPVFSSHFHGYSLMEDVTLSLQIGKSAILLNARTARIYHDSQPGSHKNNPAEIASMQLVNRYFVMTKIMNRSSFSDKLKLAALEVFGTITSLRTARNVLILPRVLYGKMKGVYQIITSS